jgi:hypothetical protein
MKSLLLIVLVALCVACDEQAKATPAGPTPVQWEHIVAPREDLECWRLRHYSLGDNVECWPVVEL